MLDNSELWLLLDYHDSHLESVFNDVGEEVHDVVSSGESSSTLSVGQPFVLEGVGTDVGLNVIVVNDVGVVVEFEDDTCDCSSLCFLKVFLS